MPALDITGTRENLLPYVITFMFLFLISLAVLTWFLDVWHKANSCATFPNYWCADDWTCNTPCPAGTPGADPCFTSQTGPTGLANCLFGPLSMQATRCYDIDVGTGGVGCDCLITNGMNCFSGCGTLAEPPEGPNTPCCCCPPSMGGPAGCPETIPSACTQGGQAMCGQNAVS